MKSDKAKVLGEKELYCISFAVNTIHSFKDLYSTSSRKLPRGAPDSSTVKKNSFQLIIECVWKYQLWSVCIWFVAQLFDIFHNNDCITYYFEHISGSTSDWCALREVLYKCIDAIQYLRIDIYLIANRIIQMWTAVRPLYVQEDNTWAVFKGDVQMFRYMPTQTSPHKW